MEPGKNEFLTPSPLFIVQKDIDLFDNPTTEFQTLIFHSTVSHIKNTTVSSSPQSLVSDDVIRYIYTINYATVCAACCLLGIVTNVINIAVFISMKFKETVNIALLGLAVSDLCSVISLLWVCICYNPFFMYSDVPILTSEVQHQTGGWTHLVFSRVIAYITVYITMERCLCIAYPLKIKAYLTPKRVARIILAIYIVIIGSLSLNYTNFRLVWKFVPSFNRTMLGMVFTDNRYVTQLVTYILNVFHIMVSFVSIIGCSGILIWKLNERGKWLHSVSVEKDMTKTARDRQVIRMVVVVAVIFIISNTPSVMFYLVITVEPKVNVGRDFQNLFMTIRSIVFIFDAINSSVNIFVYYKMNSKFASTFRRLFCDKSKF